MVELGSKPNPKPVNSVHTATLSNQQENNSSLQLLGVLFMGSFFLSPLGHNAELSTRITRLHRQIPVDRGPGWDPGLLPHQVVVSPHGESLRHLWWGLCFLILPDLPGLFLRFDAAFSKDMFMLTQVFSPRMRRWSQWTLVIQRNNMSNKFGSGFLQAQRQKRKKEKPHIVVCSTHTSLHKERDLKPRMTLGDESMCKECLVCF